ncbi:hypothetical protein Afil01_22810 [Actinorhabdospora filicis]|uniref:Uncharacterized protein n=1 Tax=Actinorhabdospora filicis TaxID=1785913 RepID=A0A9W6SI02_9ACTN|nr:hypothetical protein Afil01_22810 [Actinorhabdospora filicis]
MKRPALYGALLAVVVLALFGLVGGLATVQSGDDPGVQQNNPPTTPGGDMP